jgi:hypothetical protein
MRCNQISPRSRRRPNSNIRPPLPTHLGLLTCDDCCEWVEAADNGLQLLKRLTLKRARQQVHLVQQDKVQTKRCVSRAVDQGPDQLSLLTIRPPGSRSTWSSNSIASPQRSEAASPDSCCRSSEMHLISSSSSCCCCCCCCSRSSTAH